MLSLRAPSFRAKMVAILQVRRSVYEHHTVVKYIASWNEVEDEW